MIGANACAVVDLAHTMAEIVPLPPHGSRPDPQAHREWEDLMLMAARGLAGSVDYDEDLLSVAVGPTIEVGVNPLWRVLLQLAQLEAELNNCRLGRIDSAHRRAFDRAPLSLLAFG